MKGTRGKGKVDFDLKGEAERNSERKGQRNVSWEIKAIRWKWDEKALRIIRGRAWEEIDPERNGRVSWEEQKP